MNRDTGKTSRRSMIPAAGAALALTLMCGAALPAEAGEPGPADTGEVRPPNFVLILADDMGYGDVSVFGSTMIRTPNLDKLAADGARMTDFYAASSVCTPSRAAVLTGRYAVRSVPEVLWPTGSSHVNAVDGIPGEELTLAEVLKENGYATGMLGKWHLGDLPGHLPNDNGFDLFLGALYSNDMSPYEIYRNDDVELPDPVDQDLLTKLFTEEAVGFITEHRDEPFFLYYASPFPHEPMHASEDFRGRSEAGIYGDCVEELDRSVGVIRAALEDLGIAGDTFIVFTSDNGPWFLGSAGDSRGRKGQVFEGGQKVPFIACRPGVIPAGQVIGGMAMGIDLFPTFLEAAGVALPGDRVIDGKSILPLLLGLAQETPHDMLFYIDGTRITAVRTPEWKYMRKCQTDNANYPGHLYGPYLFDITRDVDESYNVIGNHTDVSRQLEKAIKAFERELESNRQGWINVNAQ